MKKKVITILLLLAFALAGAGVAFAQKTPKLQVEFQCTYCGKIVKNFTGKKPSNTGLCRENPSKLSTAHNYVLKQGF